MIGSKKRRDHLMKAQAKISLRRNNAKIGQTMRVLFEGDSEETDLLWQGRLETQAPDIDGCVLINDAPEDFVPVEGTMVKVLISEAQQYDLVGRIMAADGRG